MAGLLEEFGIDLDEVPDAPSYEIPDDEYDFVVGDVYKREGTDSKPDAVWIIFQFNLGDSGAQKNEWFEMPRDWSDIQPKELTKLGFYKQRLLSLGVAPEDLNNAGADNLVGLSGTLTLLTKTSKGGTYQNIYNLKVAETEEVPAAPVKAVRKPAVAKAPAPVPETVAAPVAAKAAAAGVKRNPFA